MNVPKEVGGGDCGANPPKTYQESQPNFANDGDSGKALATMKARAALCGCTLHELSDGAFLVCRWNYSKAVPCLRAVGDLLRQIGGR
ncbi:hypothetical protein [Ideonella sp. A 288]|uniref:hypothetical protein n=1 Tax=Ideonella sp. A 288 TaxID=1962181 RepID=UPI001186AB63|nr:hypothetical protein [Ideonella sp. A 288]